MSMSERESLLLEEANAWLARQPEGKKRSVFDRERELVAFARHVLKRVWEGDRGHHHRLTVSADGTLSGALPCGHGVEMIAHHTGDVACEQCRNTQTKPKTRLEASDAS